MNFNGFYDAKAQYTNILRNKAGDIIYDIFSSMYTRAKQLKGGETLVAFQTMVKDVQNWNMKQIQEAVDTVVNHCGPRFVNQCLKAIYYLNAKILSGHENDDGGDIQLRIPPIKDFVYDVLMEVAKSSYKNPSVFSTDVSPEQGEQNAELVYRMIFKAIDKAVEKSFPYHEFLQTYDRRDEANVLHAEKDPEGLDHLAATPEDEDEEPEDDTDEKEIRYGDGPEPQAVVDPMLPEKPVLHSDAEDEESDND